MITKQVHINMNALLHRRMKMLAVKLNLTIQGLIETLVEERLRKQDETVV